MQRLDEFKRRNKRPLRQYKRFVNWAMFYGLTAIVMAAGLTAVGGMVVKTIWKLL